jgi:multiple sugar transport system substrate-binding protein
LNIRSQHSQCGNAKSRRGRRAVKASLSAAFVLAVSCFPSSDAFASTSHVQPDASKISGNIAFSWWGSSSRDALTYKVIKLFEKAYPHVTVSPEPNANYDDYWEHLTVEAAAHDVPCVVTTQNTYLPSYESSSILLPLNSLIKSGAIDTSGIPQGIIAGGTSNGNVYMIGTGSAATTLVFNSAMAKKYGIPPLTNTMTWSQLQSWAEAAQKKLPSGINALDLYSEWNAMVAFYAWVRGNGQPVFVKDGSGYGLGFTKSTLENYWQWWNVLIKDGATESPGLAAEEPTTSGDDYLAQGKVLASVDTANLLADQTTLDSNGLGTVSDVLFPSGPDTNGDFGKTHGLGFDVSGMSIGANCTDVPAAAAFVNFWTNNPAAIAAYASNNGAVTVTTQLALQATAASNPAPIRSSLSFFQLMLNDDAPVNFDPPGTAALKVDFQTDSEAVGFGSTSLGNQASAFFNQATAVLGHPGA